VNAKMIATLPPAFRVKRLNGEAASDFWRGFEDMTRALFDEAEQTRQQFTRDESNRGIPAGP
jgi:hypothetical protein